MINQMIAYVGLAGSVASIGFFGKIFWYRLRLKQEGIWEPGLYLIGSVCSAHICAWFLT